MAFAGLLSSAVYFEGTAHANRFYSGLVGGAPLLQDWTDTSQISIDDNWDNVVSFQAFRGDGLTSVTGVDPQTIVADGHATPLDVNANELNPSTFTTGGAAEFEITNPTIALKGSTTADAPHLMVYINTQPCPMTKSLSIRYNVRDLDGSANDAVQALALQYRVGTAGNFTNIPAGFVADATEPNAATKVTAKFLNLPTAIIQQPEVELRFITTNAAGTDEWIGIDDIEVGCYFPTAAPVSAGGRVLTNDGRPISRAMVSIQDTLTGRRQYATTNHFGHFVFEGLESGNLFVITVGHGRYHFSIDTRVIQLTDDLKGLTFYADAPNRFKKKSRGL